MGAASAAKLAKLGIQTAADLAALKPDDARALMTVTGGRTNHGGGLLPNFLDDACSRIKKERYAMLASCEMGGRRTMACFFEADAILRM